MTSERQTLAIHFYPRNDKAKENDGITKVPLYMRITVNNKRSEMSLQRYIDSEKWNKAAGQAKGTRRETRELNEFLDLQRSKVYKAQKELLEDGKTITALALRNKVQGRSEEQKTIVEVFKYHNKLMEEMIPEEYSTGTLRKFETTFSHLKDYIKGKYKADDLLLTQLNHKFITEFDHYLRTIKGVSHNTSIKYIKNLKKVVNLSVKNEWLKQDPFAKFSVKIKPVQRDFLSEDELKLIEDLKLNITRLDQVRDIFVFCCYTGYAYIDAAGLSPSNLRKGINGKLWIYTDRQKTSTKSNVPLLPKAIEIIKKYEEHPEVIEGEKLFPILSNQKMNAYLKEIATLADIDKNLTFHLARHTFATLMLTKGISIETVAEMLGHQDIRTTQIYAKVIEQKVGEEMDEVEKKFANDLYSKKYNTL